MCLWSWASDQVWAGCWQIMQFCVFLGAQIAVHCRVTNERSLSMPFRPVWSPNQATKKRLFCGACRWRACNIACFSYNLNFLCISVENMQKRHVVTLIFSSTRTETPSDQWLSSLFYCCVSYRLCLIYAHVYRCCHVNVILLLGYAISAFEPC